MIVSPPWSRFRRGSMADKLLNSTGVDERTDWKTSNSTVAANLGFQAALSKTWLERVTFQLRTGVEYLSHVPTMRYASLGESFASGDTHAPARIEHSDAFGLFGVFSIVFEM